jgi:nitrate reductase NapAB chaperone NapD
MIVRVAPEKAEETAKKLEQISNLTTYGVHKECNIIVVAEADDAEELENLSRRIMNEFPGITGVFPTYVTFDDSE